MLIGLAKKRHYIFHGVGISISGDTELVALIHSRFRQFPMTAQDRIDLAFELCFVPDEKSHVIERPVGRARTVYEPPMGKALYIEEGDHLYITYGERLRVLCKPALGATHMSIVESDVANSWLATNPLFTLPFVESLKRRELYGLHAAGLSVDGKGVLLPGASGAGKSTLTVALLRAGFDFLTDDTIFLARGESGLRMLAFPDEIDVTDETSSHFSELNGLLDLPKRPGSRKRQLCAEEVYGANTTWECRPHALVFPRIADVEKSVVKPMGSGEALLELASNILPTETRSSQNHLDVIAELVRETDCYRLEAGRDFDAIPKLVRELVK